MEVPPNEPEEKSSLASATEGEAPKKHPRTSSRLVHGKSSRKTAASEETLSAEPQLELAPASEPPSPASKSEAKRELIRECKPESLVPAVAASEESANGGGYDQRASLATETKESSAPEATCSANHHHQQQGQGGVKFNRWRDKRFRGGGGKWSNHQNQSGPRHRLEPPPPKGEAYPSELPDPARFADLAALDQVADDIAAKKADPIWLFELYSLSHAELLSKAQSLGAKFEAIPSRRQLLNIVFTAAAEQKIPLLDRGWIDLTDCGYGFVVHESVNYQLYPENAFLAEGFIKKYGLKPGHLVEVQVQAPSPNGRCPSVVRLFQVMGRRPDEISKLKPFEELTPYYPLQRIWLETPGSKGISMRMVDILTPFGFGQRGLIVAPPRTGKTALLQNIANSVAENFPETKLIILLVDERPEEVTDFRRHCKGEVVSSTFDETPESHVHCAEMVIEKSRRLVEQGEHVIILLDSITRLARACNALASNSGKIMSGGIEATALQKAKRFFGSARNIEGSGSLTILATALIDTGSRMDEVIFEEFKGTGNMELHLDRDLSNRRIFPAINVDKSGTRKEELIYHPDELARIYGLRRAMQGVPAADSVEMLVQRLKKTKTNAEFLMGLNR